MSDRNLFHKIKKPSGRQQYDYAHLRDGNAELLRRWGQNHRAARNQTNGGPIDPHPRKTAGQILEVGRRARGEAE